MNVLVKESLERLMNLSMIDKPVEELTKTAEFRQIVADLQQVQEDGNLTELCNVACQIFGA